MRGCGREEWRKFRKYHYLNTELPTASVCFGLYDNDNIVGFIAVLHQPHGTNKKIKRVSRLVILPDYQGIGLGKKFLNVVAKHYAAQGFDFSIRTSAKNLINALRKEKDWIMVNYSATKNSNRDYNGIQNSARTKCKCGSFFFDSKGARK